MFRIGLLDYSQNPLLIPILNHNKFIYAFSLQVNNFILITIYAYFDVLFTVHLSIFISVFSQLDAQNFFRNKFISFLYMFRAPIGVIIPEAV